MAMMPGFQPGFGMQTPGGLFLPDAGFEQPFPAPDWAQGAEGDASHLGIVDYERAMRMSTDDIIACVVGARNESATARRPLEPRWRYHEALYHLRTDDPEKEQWQAQMVVPEVYNKIEVWLSQLQNALFDNPEWAKVVNENKLYDDPVARFLDKWLKLVREKSELVPALLAMWREAGLLGSGCIREDIADVIDARPHVEQRQMYADPQMAFQAAMMGMPTMRPVITTNAEPKQQLRWRQRSIWGVFPDPRAENFYEGRGCSEVDLVPEEDLQAAVDAGTYDSIDDIGEPSNVKTLTGLTPWRLGISDSNQIPRRHHQRTRYVGDIWDREGYLVARNWQVVIINDRSVVALGPNPRWSGRKPWIWSTPRPYPNRVWGRSMVDATAKAQHELTDLLNLGLDDAKFVALGLFRWDSSKSGEPQKPESLAPGEVVEGKEGLIERLVFPSAFNTTLPIKNWLDELSGKETQISEWADGRPTSRGRPSARQVMQQSAAGQAQTNSMVRRMEDDEMTKVHELMLEDMIQFGDNFDSPRFQAILDEFAPEMGIPNEARQLADPMFRFQLLDNIPWRVRVRGVSLLMDRDALGQNLMQILQLGQMLGLPPISQFEVYYANLMAMGFDPEMLNLPPTAQAYMQSLMMPPVGAAPGAGTPGGQPTAPGPAAQPGMGGPPPPSQAMNSAAGPPTMQGMQ